MNKIWIDRSITALITLMLGAAAQGLLSWRELGVLSNSVVKIEENDIVHHEAFLRTIESISERQREVVKIQAAMVERLEATRDNLQEHKHDTRVHK